MAIEPQNKLEKREQNKKRTPVNNEECCSIIHILKSSKDVTEKYGIPALMKYQFNVIARTQVQIENLQKHDYFDFCLKTRLNWSKNETGEHNCPMLR